MPSHFKKKLVPLTEEELTAVTIVFHQYETGLREGTIYTMVGEGVSMELFKPKLSRSYGCFSFV